MKRMKRRFMDIKIRGKMIYSYILIALIPFLVVGGLGIVISTREAEKSVSQHSAQTIRQVQQMVDIYISSIKKLANTLIESVRPMDFMGMSEMDLQWLSERKDIEESFRIMANTHEEIAGIFLATEKNLCANYGMKQISRDSFAEEGWYSKAAENPREIQIISNVTGRNIVTNAEYSIDNVFSVVKAVTDPKSNRILGVLIFDIKHDIISKAIQDAVIGESGFVFVLDRDDHMVYTPPSKIVYRIKPEWLHEESAPVNARIKGEKYQIRYKESNYTGWKIVSVFAYQEIMESVNTMFALFIFVLAVTTFLVIYIAVKISSTVTRPIVELAALMKQTERGDLTVRFVGDYQDEVSELGRKFNHMLSRIQNLVDTVYEEQENKRQAELKVVQEQFKPHFLYNTLDTIGWMAREHQAEDIVRLVDALTNVFRIGLSKGKDYISIQEEIRYISNYLYIQRIRYGPKVYYDIEMEDSCSRLMVPKMILQPLVENAIYHGVKMKRGDGHLKVSVLREQDAWVSMSVEDDGRGMPKEKVEELTRLLNEPTDAEENQSFGLFYIKERLRIRYGEAFQVKVDSTENAGTKITISIPADDGFGEMGN